jgi:hypothetical protein
VGFWAAFRLAEVIYQIFFREGLEMAGLRAFSGNLQLIFMGRRGMIKFSLLQSQKALAIIHLKLWGWQAFLQKKKAKGGQLLKVCS